MRPAGTQEPAVTHEPPLAPAHPTALRPRLNTSRCQRPGARNSSRARIKWMFTTEKARAKMARAYPKLSAKES
jgi:hypothetical protein